MPTQLEELRKKFGISDFGSGDEPPDQKLAPPEEFDEKAALAALLRKGFSISVVNPYGDTFPQKYHVFQHLPVIGSKVVLVDEQGKVIGLQG